MPNITALILWGVIIGIQIGLALVWWLGSCNKPKRIEFHSITSEKFKDPEKELRAYNSGPISEIIEADSFKSKES